jgi:hypothetical protein
MVAVLPAFHTYSSMHWVTLMAKFHNEAVAMEEELS